MKFRNKNKKSPTKELNKNIKKLHESVETSITFKRALWLGVARGVGTALGATIVAGILVLLLRQFLNSVEDIPLLNKFINREQVEVFIE